MERTTEAPPAVRPEVSVAPENDPIADASVAAYSADNTVAMRTPGEQNSLRVADVGINVPIGENLLDFSTDNVFKSVFAKGDNAQLAARRTEDALPGSDKAKPSLQTYDRINDAVLALEKGDTSKLHQYVRDLNDATNPDKQRDLQRGMKELTKYLGEAGIEAKMLMGSLSLKLPGHDAKALTIDPNGRTNLRGNALREFSKKFSDQLEGREKPEPLLSDRMTGKLDRIESGLRRTNLTGLQDAIKEIGDKIHSVKPGAAGAAERKEAGELQGMLETLGDELTGKNVHARYDRHSGKFAITQPDASGKPETLEIDKFGRANMSGEKLRFFLIRLRDNQEKQPTVPV